MAGDQVLSRDGDVDADPETLAMDVVLVRKVEPDPAAHHAIEESLQLVEACAYVCLERRAGGHSMEGHLQGCFHVRCCLRQACQVGGWLSARAGDAAAATPSAVGVPSPGG